MNKKRGINIVTKRLYSLKVDSIFDTAFRFTRWLHRVYPIDTGNPKETDALIAHLNRVFKTRGSREGIKYSKSLRLALIYYLTSNGRKVEGIAYTRDGIPRALDTFIKKGWHNSPRKLAVLLTILTLSRGVYLQSSPDIETITSPGKSGDLGDYQRYIGEFWNTLGYRKLDHIPKSIWWTKHHYTTKNGPNGQALWTALVDLIPLSENRELLNSIKFVGGDRLIQVLNSLISCLSVLDSFGLIPKVLKTKKLRKLVDFPDKEGKTRIIAILDYWSQTALRPIHNFLFSVLKKIPQDKTFDQGNFKESLKNAEVFYSIDLTAATDRFPMFFIKDVLKGRFPSQYVDHWSDIMCKFPFDFNGSLKHYSVGNPMGAYSSWSSFTLAHHFVVFLACKRTNTDWKSLPYCLLGDDIVIGHKAVAEEYLSIISSLGVEISLQKTHISKTTYEFAKRWIHKDEEITPFPFHSLKESGKRYYSLINVLLESESKGWILGCSIPEAIELFYTYIVKRPSRFRKSLDNKVRISESIMKIMRGSLPATEINNLIRQLEFRIPILTEEECINILSNVTVEIFAESNPENQSEDDKKKAKPLGLVAFNHLLIMTSDDFINSISPLIDDPYSFPSYIPILNCYGQVEEMYGDLRKRAKRVDTIHSGEWPLLLRSMLLPISDEAFYARASDMIPYASSLFGTKLLQRFEVLQSPMGRRLLGR